MLRSRNQAYVCWRCLASRNSSQQQHHQSGSGLRLLRPRNLRQLSTTASLLISSPSSASTTNTKSTLATPTSSQRRGLASYADPTFRIPSRNDESHIRQQLRQWEAENPATLLAIPGERDEPAGPLNGMTTGQNTQAFRNITGDYQNPAPRFEGGELIDLGDAISGLMPGDMIEVSSDTWRIPVLAVCLGNFNGYEHFYTDTGKWFAERDVRTRFVVKRFILDPGELQPVIDAIPATVPEAKILGALADLNLGPTRDVGLSLRSQMLEFHESARRHNHIYSESLNRIPALVGPTEKLMTLEEIASALLPASAQQRGRAELFPISLLYAVHCSICMYHNLVFRPLQQNNRRYQTYLYAVSSEGDLQNIHNVEDMMRRISADPSGKSKGSSDSSRAISRFQVFLQRARQAIDRSRRSRKWSQGGLLGPARKSIAPSTIRWSREDMELITFIQQWAASSRIPRTSPLHWVGAAILRATERYTEAEYLDSSVGWTFLQEIGWTAPWDIPSRHVFRLPGVPAHRSRPDAPSVAAKEQQQLGPDLLASIRTDFKSATVYCIDAESAEDIDDGMSLQRTEKDGEYWINIHVADPASRIAPNSLLAKQAALKAQTTYLTGYIDPMFTAEAVRETFSLGPDRPSLTFSARVNENGDILDYRISPHIIKDVVYLTPQDAASITGEDSVSPFSVPAECFQVGSPPNPAPPTRKMTRPEELSKKQVEDIKILEKLAKTLHAVRLRAGCTPAYLPEPKAEVSFDHTTVESVTEGFVHCTGDPFIRVAYDDNQSLTLVSSLMQLAGNVAARWCNERKIPIPYRVQLLAEQNSKALKDYTQGYLYPKLLAGEKPSNDDLRVLRNLAGGFSLATKPSFNPSMGMDMYTKATSPLRRYSDLLVHWQVEAALLEESLRGSDKKGGDQKKKPTHSLLPFTREILNEKVLPHLLIRERYSQRVANYEGNKTWILQALARAWRFGEGREQLPKTFRFTVERMTYNRVWGTLDWFEQDAMIPIGGLGGGIRLGDVKLGDEYVVELEDVDVYNGLLTCKVLERA